MRHFVMALMLSVFGLTVAAGGWWPEAEALGLGFPYDPTMLWGVEHDYFVKTYSAVVLF